MAYSGGAGLSAPARGPAKGPGVPPQFANFAKNGGWSILSKPGVAQGYANALMNTAQHPHGPAVPHPPTPGPPAPVAPSPGGGAPSPPTPPAPPFDSTYYANVAANTFKTGNQINALNLQGTQNDTALQSALGQLAYQQPRDSLKLEEAANRNGGLFSQSYDAQQADLGHQYLGKQFAAQTSHDQTRDRLAAQIGGLQAGIPYYNSQQEADSASRLAAAAAKDPTLGQGTGGLNTQPGQVTGGTQQGINRAASQPANPPRPGPIPLVAPKKPSALANRWVKLANAAAKNPNMWLQIAQHPHGRK